MRFCSLFAAAALLLGMQNFASAGVLGSVLTPDKNVIDTLTDDSRAFFVDNNSNSLIDAGDALFGFVQITSTTKNGLINPPTVVGVFSAKIVTGSPAGPWELGAITAAEGATVGGDFEGLDLASIAPTLSGAASGNGATAGDFDKSIFLVGSRGDDFNYLLHDETGGTDFDNAKAEIAKIDSEIGYDALAGLGSSDDFFKAAFNTLNPSQIDEVGGFTVFNHTLNGTILPIFSAVSGKSHDLLLSGIIRSDASDAPWAFQNNANFQINMVPEPGSMLIFAGLFGLAGLRRRKS